MASVYPGALPVAEAAGANLSTNPHSSLHNDMYDDIVAIATELGTNPSGSYATVLARLNAVEAVKSWGARYEGSSASYSNSAQVVSVTVPVKAGRRYLILAQAECIESAYSGGRNVGIQLNIVDQFTYGTAIFSTIQGVTTPETMHLMHWYQPSSDVSQEIAIRAYNSAGGSVWITGGTYGAGPRIYVEDVGPTT